MWLISGGFWSFIIFVSTADQSNLQFSAVNMKQRKLCLTTDSKNSDLQAINRVLLFTQCYY